MFSDRKQSLPFKPYLVVAQTLCKDMGSQLEVASDERASQELALFEMGSTVFNVFVETDNFLLKIIRVQVKL